MLLASFYDDGDGTGKLHVRATSDGFSGEGGAWFSNQKVLEFADGIAAFPISEKNPPALKGGFYKRDKSGELDQEHLALAVYPIDRTGHLAVQVRIATEVWEQTRPESQRSVKLEIRTSYQPILQFSQDLKALVNGAVAEAVLHGEL